jgi:hypothetical protein
VEAIHHSRGPGHLPPGSNREAQTTDEATTRLGHGITDDEDLRGAAKVVVERGAVAGSLKLRVLQQLSPHGQVRMELRPERDEGVEGSKAAGGIDETAEEEAAGPDAVGTAAQLAH